MNPLWILLIGMVVVMGGILVLRLHAFVALIAGALLVAALTPQASVYRATIASGGSPESAQKAAHQTIGERVADGFGRTTVEIGILIAMAAIVGQSLLYSGGAERIVTSSRRALGDKHAGLTFLVSGFILGIPVFFDTVFYLLIPLVKVMRVRSGRDYVLYVLGTVAGATMTHSLVPPTPGPLFVAAELKVNMATMILGGLIIGAIASGAGYAYALWANQRWDIPLREAAIEAAPPDDSTLPPLWLSLTPILLPVVLLTLRASFETHWAVRIFGEKNVAMSIAAAISLLMLWRRRAQTNSPRDAVGEALESAGVIILITAAGGAFGYVLRQTDIASAIKQILPVSKLSLLPLAFFMTALIRTAQGSATVAMITAAGIMSPLAASGALSFHPVYLALAIGCGSKPIPWMNDSGFWIISRMSGFTEQQTLKTCTVMMTLMGVAGLLATILAAWLFPLM